MESTLIGQGDEEVIYKETESDKLATNTFGNARGITPSENEGDIDHAWGTDSFPVGPGRLHDFDSDLEKGEGYPLRNQLHLFKCPSVQKTVRRLWDVLPLDEGGELSMEVYVEVNLRLQRSLSTDFELQCAINSATGDWQDDVPVDRTTMSAEEFAMFLFELCALWCGESVLLGTYLFFLNAVYINITEARGTETIGLKPLVSVRRLPDAFHQVLHNGAGRLTNDSCSKGAAWRDALGFTPSIDPPSVLETLRQVRRQVYQVLHDMRAIFLFQGQSAGNRDGHLLSSKLLGLALADPRINTIASTGARPPAVPRSSSRGLSHVAAHAVPRSTCISSKASSGPTKKSPSNDVELVRSRGPLQHLTSPPYKLPKDCPDVYKQQWQPILRQKPGNVAYVVSEHNYELSRRSNPFERSLRRLQQISPTEVDPALSPSPDARDRSLAEIQKRRLQAIMKRQGKRAERRRKRRAKSSLFHVPNGSRSRRGELFRELLGTLSFPTAPEVRDRASACHLHHRGHERQLTIAASLPALPAFSTQVKLWEKSLAQEHGSQPPNTQRADLFLATGCTSCVDERGRPHTLDPLQRKQWE